MFANYHTHTARCHHAIGTERQYVEAAIQAGYKVLGFADHGTYIIDNFNYRIRMRPDEVAEYINTLKALREEYKNDIRIHIGFELEYYPSHFDKTLEFLKQFDYEYLILGQHYVDDGIERTHVIKPTTEEEDLKKYVDTVIAGIRTGKFSYVAHPDVVGFNGDDEIYRAHMTRLCRAAKEEGIPLEINCLGVHENRCYPNEKFWKIARDVGNSVIIGVDAHKPQLLLNRDIVKRCEEISRKFDLFPVRELKFRNPKI